MRIPKIIKLPSGLNVILYSSGQFTTVTILILVKNGADYETKQTNGISHFIEHLVFKGSKKFPTPSQLATELDKIGAVYNAFTGYEYTGYFIKTFSEYLPKAIEIISDIVINPIFPEEEIEKERKVILEEIKYYQDTPTKFIHHLIQESLYGDQPAGRDILGTTQTIKSLQKRKILDFYSNHYSSKNTTVVIVGDFNNRKALGILEKNFSKYNRGRIAQKNPAKTELKKFNHVFLKKDVNQGHLIVAFKTDGITKLKDKKFSLGVLTSILGYGFSSRMFRLLREELSATYYLNVDTNLFADRGYLYIQTGSDLPRLEKVLGLIIREIKKLKTEKTGKDELAKAKAVLENYLLMSAETSDSLASFWGSSYLIETKIYSPKEIIKKIKSVKDNEILDTAASYFTAQRANLALILPSKPNFALQKIFNII
jgi:predicted Zn-dependent peptidase